MARTWDDIRREAERAHPKGVPAATSAPTAPAEYPQEPQADTSYNDASKGVARIRAVSGGNPDVMADTLSAARDESRVRKSGVVGGLIWPTLRDVGEAGANVVGTVAKTVAGTPGLVYDAASAIGEDVALPTRFNNLVEGNPQAPVTNTTDYINKQLFGDPKKNEQQYLEEQAALRKVDPEAAARNDERSPLIGAITRGEGLIPSLGSELPAFTGYDVKSGQWNAKLAHDTAVKDALAPFLALDLGFKVATPVAAAIAGKVVKNPFTEARSVHERTGVELPPKSPVVESIQKRTEALLPRVITRGELPIVSAKRIPAPARAALNPHNWGEGYFRKLGETWKAAVQEYKDRKMADAVAQEAALAGKVRSEVERPKALLEDELLEKSGLNPALVYMRAGGIIPDEVIPLLKDTTDVGNVLRQDLAYVIRNHPSQFAKEVLSETQRPGSIPVKVGDQQFYLNQRLIEHSLTDPKYKEAIARISEESATATERYAKARGMSVADALRNAPNVPKQIYGDRLAKSVFARLVESGDAKKHGIDLKYVETFIDKGGNVINMKKISREALARESPKTVAVSDAIRDTLRNDVFKNESHGGLAGGVAEGSQVVRNSPAGTRNVVQIANLLAENKNIPPQVLDYLMIQIADGAFVDQILAGVERHPVGEPLSGGVYIPQTRSRWAGGKNPVATGANRGTRHGSSLTAPDLKRTETTSEGGTLASGDTAAMNGPYTPLMENSLTNAALIDRQHAWDRAVKGLPIIPKKMFDKMKKAVTVGGLPNAVEQILTAGDADSVKFFENVSHNLGFNPAYHVDGFGSVTAVPVDLFEKSARGVKLEDAELSQALVDEVNAKTRAWQEDKTAKLTSDVVLVPTNLYNELMDHLAPKRPGAIASGLDTVQGAIKGVYVTSFVRTLANNAVGNIITGVGGGVSPSIMALRSPHFALDFLRSLKTAATELVGTREMRLRNSMNRALTAEEWTTVGQGAFSVERDSTPLAKARVLESTRQSYADHILPVALAPTKLVTRPAAMWRGLMSDLNFATDKWVASSKTLTGMDKVAQRVFLRSVAARDLASLKLSIKGMAQLSRLYGTVEGGIEAIAKATGRTRESILREAEQASANVFSGYANMSNNMKQVWSRVVFFAPWASTTAKMWLQMPLSHPLRFAAAKHFAELSRTNEVDKIKQNPDTAPFKDYLSQFAGPTAVYKNGRLVGFKAWSVKQWNPAETFSEADTPGRAPGGISPVLLAPGNVLAGRTLQGKNLTGAEPSEYGGALEASVPPLEKAKEVVGSGAELFGGQLFDAGLLAYDLGSKALPLIQKWAETVSREKPLGDITPQELADLKRTPQFLPFTQMVANWSMPYNPVNIKHDKNGAEQYDSVGRKALALMGVNEVYIPIERAIIERTMLTNKLRDTLVELVRKDPEARKRVTEALLNGTLGDEARTLGGVWSRWLHNNGFLAESQAVLAQGRAGFLPLSKDTAKTVGGKIRTQRAIENKQELYFPTDSTNP